MLVWENTNELMKKKKKKTVSLTYNSRLQSLFLRRYQDFNLNVLNRINVLDKKYVLFIVDNGRFFPKTHSIYVLAKLN